MGEFQGCMLSCPMAHRHVPATVILYRDEIIWTTQRERLLRAMRGVLIHELCHWFGLSDQQAWKVGEGSDWFQQIQAQWRLVVNPNA